MWHYVAILIFVKLTHYIFNVKTLSAVVEQLVEIIALKLTLIEFFTTILINYVSLIWNCKPAMVVYSTCLFINIESLSSLHKNWFSIRIIKVSKKVMRVEVMLFNAERSWDFTTFVKIIIREHGLAGQVFNNIIGLRVSKVTALIYWISLFVMFTTILVFKYNNVSFVITIQITKHIMLIESSQLCVGWNSN